MRRLKITPFSERSDDDILAMVIAKRDNRLKRFQAKAEVKKKARANGTKVARKPKDKTAAVNKLLKQLTPEQLKAIAAQAGR